MTPVFCSLPAAAATPRMAAAETIILANFILGSTKMAAPVTFVRTEEFG